MVRLGNQAKAALDSINIQEVNLATLADGSYIGEFDAKIVYARVRVTVNDHRIAGIEIVEHRHGRGATGEKIIAEIIAKQSLQVDAVSGATFSSKVITKAVEASLRKQ